MATDAEVIVHGALNIVDPTEGSGGGRASAVQVGVVKGRYLLPALRLLGPANARRATLLPLITLIGALPTATFARHNGAPLDHETTLGARVDIIHCCDEAQKDLGWLVCRHHGGVGAGVLCLLVWGRRDCHSFKRIERSRDRESRVIWPKGQGDLSICCAKREDLSFYVCGMTET